MTPTWLWPVLAASCAVVALWRFFRWADCDCLLYLRVRPSLSCYACRCDFVLACAFAALSAFCLHAPRLIAWLAGRWA